MDDFIIEKDTLVKYVGSDADIVIPNGIKKIDDDAIDLTSIKTLTIPKSVRRIGDLGHIVEKAGDSTSHDQELPSRPTIFFDCNLGDYLRISNQSAYVFNCSCKVMVKQRSKYVWVQKLKEITIPNDIVYLEDQLCYCGMKRVILGKKVKRLWGSFFMCSHLKEVVFNDCLEHIGEATFSDCISLGPIVKFPSSVKTMDLDCFRNCQNLTTIYAGPNLNTKTFAIYDPFEELDHKVPILVMTTKKEIYVHRP